MLLWKERRKLPNSRKERKSRCPTWDTCAPQVAAKTSAKPSLDTGVLIALSSVHLWRKRNVRRSLDCEVRRDLQMHDEVERRTNPTAITIAQEKARATRRTLYFLLFAIVSLLLNVFGVFLYVTFADRIAPSSIW